MRYTLRPLVAPDDYDALAAFLTRTTADETTAAKLAEADGRLPESTIRSRQVAVDEAGAMVGYGFARRYPFQPAGQFMARVLVAPAVRHEGIGSALLAAVEGSARDNGGTTVTTHIKDDDPGSRAYAEKRGYALDKHLFWSELDLSSFEAERFLGAVRSLEEAGMRFCTMADLPGEENRRALYELERHAAADNPGEDLPDFLPYEDWVKAVSRPDRPGELCFVAQDGDRLVGMTDLFLQPDGETAFVGFTGVHREYRGRGFALALKVLAVLAARQRGLKRMRTENDSRNLSMLAVNRKMGFVPMPGWLEMTHRLSGEDGGDGVDPA